MTEMWKWKLLGSGFLQTLQLKVKIGVYEAVGWGLCSSGPPRNKQVRLLPSKSAPQVSGQMFCFNVNIKGVE